MQSSTEHSRTLLRGKVALLVGASRGIGAAIARALADAGATVALAARDSAALEQLRDELIAAGGQAQAVPTDVTDADAVARLIDLTMKTFGRIGVQYADEQLILNESPSALHHYPKESCYG
jgi:NAD(P)-dependent dehydrogenase (short-subunit alcohol dehydrogenase family)